MDATQKQPVDSHGCTQRLVQGSRGFVPGVNRSMLLARLGGARRSVRSSGQALLPARPKIIAQSHKIQSVYGSFDRFFGGNLTGRHPKMSALPRKPLEMPQFPPLNGAILCPKGGGGGAEQAPDIASAAGEVEAGWEIFGGHFHWAQK